VDESSETAAKFGHISDWDFSKDNAEEDTQKVSEEVYGVDDEFADEDNLVHEKEKKKRRKKKRTSNDEVRDRSTVYIICNTCNVSVTRSMRKL
jgi:hypothetical protein